MRLVHREIIDELYYKAEKSDRKRAHYLFHGSYQDKVQRFLIALVKGSYVSPHYHEFPHQWEMFNIIEGCVEICIYDKFGSVRKTFLAGPEQQITIVEFVPGDIHSVECLSDRALLLEIKEGPFEESNAKVFMNFS